MIREFDISTLSKTERVIYDRAGGGAEGEYAVMQRRRYMSDYSRVESDYAYEKKCLQYIPKSEKTTGTLPMLEDIYED